MIICPMLAALGMRLKESGGPAAAALLARAYDLRRLRSPVAISQLVFINPAVFTVAYLIQWGLGVEMPAPDIALFPTLELAAVFLVAGLCEELGWTGYALEPLQGRWGSPGAGLIIGVVWAAWHSVPLVQANRSLEWIAWWSLWTVAARFLMVWLYNHTGKSVFGVSLYHALSNVCWQLYPIHGSYFDPQIMAVVTLVFAIVLVPIKRGED